MQLTKFANKNIALVADGERSGSHSVFFKLKIDNKMANHKDFKTVMIRNLDSDENKDILAVLNEFMSQKDIKTAQSGIEGIIRAYNIQKHKIERIERTTKQKEESDQKKINLLEAENEKMKSALRYFDYFTKSLQSIDLR